MTKLRSIGLRNFKGVGEFAVKIPIRPITLLFGPNSAGKSTVLQAMQYAREILERNNVNPDRTIAGGDAIDLGGFDGLVHNHEKDRTVELEFELEVDDDGLLSPMYDRIEADLVDQIEKASVPAISDLFDEEQTGSERTSRYDSLKKELASWQNLGLNGEINTVSVLLEITWDAEKQTPFLSTVKTGLNGVMFASVTTKGFQQQSNINPNLKHPVFDLLDPVEELDQEIVDYSFPVGVLRADWLGESDLPCDGERSYQTKQDELRLDVDDGLSAIADFYGYSSREWAMILDKNVSGPIRLLTSFLKSLRYVGPIRDIPARNFNPHRHPSESRWASGLGAWDCLYRRFKGHTAKDDRVRENIRRWLSDTNCLNLGVDIESFSWRELPQDHEVWYNLRIAALEQSDLPDDFIAHSIMPALESFPVQSRVRMIDVNSDMEIEPHDLGVGVSQVLPVVVGAIEPGFSILTVEQPELHIHPALQVSLADLFIEQIRNSDCQFLLETHSEHLMLRLLKRVRQTSDREVADDSLDLRPDDISVVVIQNTTDDAGETRIEFLAIPTTEDGDFELSWPNGFFDERINELFE